MPASAAFPPPPGQERPSVLARAATTSLRFLLVVAAGWVLLQVVTRLQTAILPVVAALLIATVLVPPAAWLRRHGWPSPAAAGVVVLGGLLLLGGVIAALAPQVADQFGDVGTQAGAGIDELRRWLVTGPLHLSQRQVDNGFDQLRQQAGASAGQVAQGVLGGAALLSSTLAMVLLTLVFTFMVVSDGERMTGFVVDLVGGRRGEFLRGAGERAWQVMSGWVRGAATVGLVDATLIGVGLAVLGVPLVLPLAVLTFLTAFFPIVGATVAGGVAALVALVDGGPTKALLVVGLTFLVNTVDGNLLQPLVMSGAVNLHPAVVLFVLTAGATIGGITGALFAVPLTAVASRVVGYYREVAAQQGPATVAVADGGGAAATPPAGVR